MFLGLVAESASSNVEGDAADGGVVSDASVAKALRTLSCGFVSWSKALTPAFSRGDLEYRITNAQIVSIDSRFYPEPREKVGNDN